jgi:hypothetical protein
MCLSCGCNAPDDDHGDKRNITTKSLQDAAQAGGVNSAQEVVKNIQQGFETAGSGSSKTAAMAGSGSGNKQSTGGNEQSFEKRQSGYGSGTSSGPQ